MENFWVFIKVSTWQGKNVEVPYLAFSQGSIFMSNAGEKAVLRYNLSGKLLAIYRKKSNNKEGFPMATGIAADNQNRIYIIEKGIGKVARFIPPVARVSP